MFEYQYDFHRQRIDSFFELLEGVGQPNMFLLRSHKPVSKQTFRDFCEHLRDDTLPVELAVHNLEPDGHKLAAMKLHYGLSIESMGAAY